jgi:hypothetical protein
LVSSRIACFTEQPRAVNGVIESSLFSSQDRVSFAGRFLHRIAQSEIDGLARLVQWEMMEIERKSRMREIDIEDACWFLSRPIPTPPSLLLRQIRGGGLTLSFAAA